MKRRRTIALIVTLIMSLALLAACAPAGGGTPAGSPPPAGPAPGGGVTAPTAPTVPEAPPEGEDVNLADSLVIHTDGTPIAVVDPFNAAIGAGPVNWVFNLIYDNLVEWTIEGEYVPGLATRWTTSDFQTFRFFLREGVVFHNGDRFTARDVEYSILKAQDSPGSISGDWWRPVQRINIINDFEIELVLNGVTLDFLFNVAHPTTGIVNQRAIESDPETGVWVGTGLYRLTGFESGNYVDVERFDDYWGEPALTRQLSLRSVPEMTARTIMLQNGEHDISFGIIADDVALFRDDPDNYTILPLTMNNMMGIAFNMNHPIMADHNFRMAVAHAIDREEICIITGGVYPVTDGTVWGFATPFRKNDIPIIPFDLDKAQEYLDASIYNGEEISLSTAIPTNIRASVPIQQQLGRIGIDIAINQLDSPGFHAATNYHDNRTEMSMMATTVNLVPASLRSVFMSGGASNRASYNNPEVAALMDAADRLTDVTARRNAYHEVQEIVAYDIPYIPVFWRLNEIVASMGVGGVVLPNDGPLTDIRYIFKVLPD